MAGVQVGALELLISALGADQTIADIRRVDAAATAAGAKPHHLTVDARGATEAGREVTAAANTATTALGRTSAGANASYRAVATAMRAEVAGVATVAKESAATVDTSLRASLARANSTSTLMRRLATATGIPGAGRMAGVVSAAEGTGLAGLRAGAGTLLGGLGITLGAAAAVSGFSSMVSGAITASNNLATSLRVLESTSKLTGVPISFLRATSDQLSRSLGITTTTMNGMVATAARFTSVAGRTNETGVFLTRWLELAAARGLSAADAMQALESTMRGDDSGLNKLGLMNPSGIYDKWAASMGTTAAKMTGVQKQQAIINEVMTEGAKVQGAYADRMNTAEGAQERLTNAKESFLVALGQAITGGTGYTGILSTLTGILDGFTAGVRSSSGGIRQFVTDLGSIASLGATLIGFFSDVGRALDLFNARMQVAAAWAHMGLAFGSAESQANYRQARANLDAMLSGKAADPVVSSSVSSTLTDFMHAPRAPIVTTAKALTDAQRRAAANRAMSEALRQQQPELQAMEAAMKAVTPGVGMTGSSPTAERFGLTSKELMSLGDPMAQAARVAQGEMNKHPVFLTFRFDPKNSRLLEASREFADDIGKTVASSISAGFGAAFTRAFQGGGVLSSIGAGFAALTKGMLGGLGSAMVAFGEKALMASTLMAAIQKGLNALLPGGAIVASLAMIAIGSALAAGAQGMFGGESGRGAGGGSFSAPIGGDITTRTTLGPRAAPVGGQMAPTGRTGTPSTVQPIVNNFTVIGQNDPVAQRQIAGMVDRARRRGIG